MKTVLLRFYFLLSIFIYSINSIAIDDFHCKVPTCRDFYFGLKNSPHRKQYENVCFDTVFALQAIPRKHGKCVHEKTGKLNPPCIYALAEIIKKCIRQLSDLTEYEARYYCGFTLMKYCAVHLGLDKHPQNFV